MGDEGVETKELGASTAQGFLLLLKVNVRFEVTNCDFKINTPTGVQADKQRC